MTDLVSFFTIDWSLAIAIAKPITFEQGRAFYLNPIALFQGDVDAPVKLHIAKSPDGIAAAQTAVATDEVDTFKRLAPDGSGGVRWALPLEGGTIALAASADHITSTFLNEGLWLVNYHSYSASAGFSGTSLGWGSASILNGTIIAQSYLAASSATGTYPSSSKFSVSGSGASKTITLNHTSDSEPSSCPRRMIATRVG